MPKTDLISKSSRRIPTSSLLSSYPGHYKVQQNTSFKCTTLHADFPKVFHENYQTIKPRRAESPLRILLKCKVLKVSTGHSLFYLSSGLATRVGLPPRVLRLITPLSTTLPPFKLHKSRSGSLSIVLVYGWHFCVSFCVGWFKRAELLLGVINPQSNITLVDLDLLHGWKWTRLDEVLFSLL